MNIYLVVEGPIGEKQVYSHWVPLTNPSLSVVRNIDDVTNDSLFIISGGGYPNYFDVIEAGAFDVADLGTFDRLVVAIDSEDMSYEEKMNEVDDFIRELNLTIEYRIIVQHFCLETWALGNKSIVSSQPRDPKVVKYRNIFDVLNNDPELLPGLPDESLNRAQFAEYYLRRLLNEKFRNLTYSKSNPSILLHETYYQSVKERLHDTGHIQSFGGFLESFV